MPCASDLAWFSTTYLEFDASNVLRTNAINVDVVIVNYRHPSLGKSISLFVYLYSSILEYMCQVLLEEIQITMRILLRNLCRLYIDPILDNGLTNAGYRIFHPLVRPEVSCCPKILVVLGIRCRQELRH